MAKDTKKDEGKYVRLFLTDMDKQSLTSVVTTRKEAKKLRKIFLKARKV